MIPDRLKDRFDPVYAAWLDASNPPLPEGYEPTLEQMRAGFREQVAISNGPLSDHIVTEDAIIIGRDGHSIPVRFYRHRDAHGPQPLCCFLHGGGWVLGDIDTHQGVCNDTALHTGVTVVSIDYRLSPEHRFPDALHDTVDVLEALIANADAHAIDADRMMISADSAGTNLGVAAALTLRGTSAAPKALALVYPALGADMDRPSFAENADVPGLTPASMRFFFTSYIGGEVLPDPLAAPLTVDDLGGLPPVFISCAELDPLRDDATDFAARLEAIDQSVTLRIERGLGHGFLWVRKQSPAAGAAFEALCRFIVSSIAD